MRSPIKNRNRDGWTHEAFQDARDWGQEYEGAGDKTEHYGPVWRPWMEKIQQVDKLLKGYMDTYWPSNVLGWQCYRLTVNRQGKVTAIVRCSGSTVDIEVFHDQQKKI